MSCDLLFHGTGYVVYLRKSYENNAFPERIEDRSLIGDAKSFTYSIASLLSTSTDGSQLSQILTLKKYIKIILKIVKAFLITVSELI